MAKAKSKAKPPRKVKRSGGDRGRITKRRKPARAAVRNTKGRRGVIHGGDRERITPRQEVPEVAPVVRGPQLSLLPSRSANASIRDEGRLRPVVSIRLGPGVLGALNAIAAARPHGWRGDPWPRTMMIEEALRDYIAKNDALVKRGEAILAEHVAKYGKARAA